MAPHLQACPRCDYPMAAFGGRCSECGVETPADLHVLRGGIGPGHLSKRDLLINIAARVLVGGFILVFATAMGAYALHLLKTASRVTADGVFTGGLLLAALYGAALFILYKVPRRVRALATSEQQPQTARWAWTASELWPEASAYPERSRRWRDIDTVMVTARAGWVSVLLQGRETLFGIAFLGSAEDAKAVRADFEKLIAHAKGLAPPTDR